MKQRLRRQQELARLLGKLDVRAFFCEGGAADFVKDRNDRLKEQGKPEAGVSDRAGNGAWFWQGVGCAHTQRVRRIEGMNYDNAGTVGSPTDGPPWTVFGVYTDSTESGYAIFHVYAKSAQKETEG